MAGSGAVVGDGGAIGSRCACVLGGGSGCRSGSRGATSGCGGFVGDCDGAEPDAADPDGADPDGADPDGAEPDGGAGVSRGVNTGDAGVAFCRPVDGVAPRVGAVGGADGASNRINADNPAKPSTSAAAPYTISERNDARGRSPDFE